MFWLGHMYLFIYNTPYSIIQVLRSIVHRRDRIQGMIDRDTLFCLLCELISHAEEKTSGHKGFQKKTPTDCPSIATLHTSWPRRPGQTPFLDPKVLIHYQMRRGHREVVLEMFVSVFFTVSLSPQCFRVSLRSLACPVLEKIVCAFCHLWSFRT